jgi:hypothetical protein
MDTEKTCGTDAESNTTTNDLDINFSSNFLTRLTQLQDDDEDEEPVDNTQD